MAMPRNPLGALVIVFGLAITAIAGHAAAAQTQYHHLDSRRPVRVEGTDPTPRFALAADVAPFQIERLAGGTMRYRADPKFAYGILPFTDIEFRVPMVQVNPPVETGALSSAGIAGVAIGAKHAFNVETTHWPALAIDGEALLPVGGLAPGKASFIMKALLTRTTAAGRLHLNAGIGTWAIRAPEQDGEGCDTACVGSRPPFIIDVPCNLIPRTSGRAASISASRCMAALPDSLPAGSSASAVAPVRLSGGRWFGGVAFDHAFPVRSTLLVADLFAERFIGLFPKIDWTAEAGLRHQVTPRLVVDAGVGRRFAGTTQSTTFVVGATYEFATPPWSGR
jgi:hypothetical protein